jgi:hypothetical protein
VEGPLAVPVVPVPLEQADPGGNYAPDTKGRVIRVYSETAGPGFTGSYQSGALSVCVHADRHTVLELKE